MKNLILIALTIFSVSCIPIGDSKEKKEATKEEKVGKLSLTKAEAKSYSFTVNGKKLEEAKIPYGCKVALTLNGATGFKEEKGKYECNAGVTIYNSKNEEIVKLDNLYKEEFPNGVPVERFNNELFLSLRCQTPLKINETYKFVFRIKDLRSESNIEIVENFTMMPTIGLVYEEKGLISDGAFLYNSNDADMALSENKLKSTDTLYVYFTGVNGLTETDGMVWPDASMQLLNEFGDVLAEFDDLYKEYSKTGVSAADTKELIALHLMLPGDLKSGKKYSATYKVGDKKAKDKYLTAKYDFVIQ